MNRMLTVSVGQHSDKGRKEINQDFHGACIPREPALSSKGVAVALADGISTSDVSREASELAVRSFLDDYYCTSDAWSVKRSGQRVLEVANSWLHAQTRRSQYRYERDRGYVCTLSAMVIKGTVAHLFHVGDARIWRVHPHALEQLTDDHRVWLSSEQHYLARALGAGPQLEIDYQALPLAVGEVFLLTTDGVHEYIAHQDVADALAAHAGNLDAAARAIVQAAHGKGSPDNLSAQLVRIDALPAAEAQAIPEQRAALALPPPLQARMHFEGYTIVRELHVSHRSHIHLAVDEASGQRVAIKTPAVDKQDDPAYLDRFLLEEWIARRLNNAHVAKPFTPARPRQHLHVAMEYIEGRTLAQWMVDHPAPDLDTVRSLVEQIARGLQAFHRMEMLHQDLRPANLMIDATGTVKIIDFGAAHVAGLAEAEPGAGPDSDPGEILGTEQYAAPEYFVGEGGSPASDLYSLGVITYQLLTGRLPYGAQVARIRTKTDQMRLRYASALDERRAIPAWIDEVLRRAVHPDPRKRYDTLSEFVQDLRHPNPAFLNRTRPSLLEKNPLRFWQGVSFALGLLVVVLLVLLHAPR
ncbi:protein kinase [Niveibacterium sp. SC-1]|uniref:protein kinase domain-containing protein n=1 Tax=Niveibacterium sp. SC-1 TaxID=3135646 RepID=UPI00311D8F28